MAERESITGYCTNNVLCVSWKIRLHANVELFNLDFSHTSLATHLPASRNYINVDFHARKISNAHFSIIRPHPPKRREKKNQQPPKSLTPVPVCQLVRTYLPSNTCKAVQKQKPPALEIFNIVPFHFYTPFDLIILNLVNTKQHFRPWSLFFSSINIHKHTHIPTYEALRVQLVDTCSILMSCCVAALYIPRAISTFIF